MRYWFDTEFIENGKTIDLLSIGIVAEDGREFYAESSEADWSQASEWVKENVLPHLNSFRRDGDGFTRACDAVSRAAIRQSLVEFCDVEKYGLPEFWGYFSAYDHVALCQLFGTMMNLPARWPMYTRDIQQWAGALGVTVSLESLVPDEGIHNALTDARWTKKAWQFLKQHEANK